MIFLFSKLLLPIQKNFLHGQQRHHLIQPKMPIFNIQIGRLQQSHPDGLPDSPAFQAMHM
jgi:hypothetical protein